MKFLHAMVRVKDLDASMNFYCQGLGLKEVYRNEYPQGKFTLVYLAAPEDYEQAKDSKSPLIELTYNWPEEGSTIDYGNAKNFGHLAFAVNDIYAVCERVQKMGVDINRSPKNGRMAFFKSPDGISIELLQKGKALEPKEPWASMPNQGDW